MQLEQLQRTPCEERSGFLFSHACSQLAYNRCDSCGKAVCEAHMQWVDAAELSARQMLHPTQPAPVTDHAAVCTTCAKKLAQRPDSSARRYHNDYDPFWYSTSYYPGYGYYGPGHWGAAYLMGSSFSHPHGHPTSRPYDPNDFTEADSASIRNEGDANFEVDTSGS